MNVNITFPQSNSAYRQLIKWDNPIAIADGYCAACRPVNGQPSGQFSMCPVYVTDLQGNWENTWAENQMATPLTNEQMLQIASLQIVDEYSVSQKMNWMMWGGGNTWGAPLKATYPSGDKWMEATNIKMITAVYAGQWVEIVGKQTTLIDFAGRKEYTPMSQIKTYYPNDWSNPLATQKVTEVDNDNVYGEKPKGTVRLPIYFGNRLAWILDRWLEA